MVEEHVYDLMPGYALGILDEDDLIKVTRHLSHCALCKEELSTYTQTANQLVLATPLKTPPAYLKVKVLERIDGKTKSRSVIGERMLRDLTRPGEMQPLNLMDRIKSLVYPGMGWMVGAIALVLLLFLAVNNIILWQKANALQAQVPSGRAHMVHLTSTENAPQAVGYLLVFEGDNYGTLTVESAPTLDANHQYQIWLVKDGKRTSGGVFSVSEDGYGVLEIASNQPLTNYQSFGITIEPKGGSPAPTGKKVLDGSL